LLANQIRVLALRKLTFHTLRLITMSCSSFPVHASSLQSKDNLVRTRSEQVQTKAGEHGWDVCRGSRKDGLQRLTMIPPAVTRAIGNLAGGAAVAGGYACGKIGEAVGGEKAVDSDPFHAGAMSWLWCNGIFPQISFESTEESAGQLSRFYGTPDFDLEDDDMEQTPLLLANHISYLDGPVLAACFRSPKIVAMAGTRNVPVVGKLMEEMDTVFVDRGDRGSRNATQEAIKTHCDQWTPGEKPMLIFPEGTTTNGEGLLEFKKGAFVPGAPVRPVIIVYTGQWDPACTTYRDGTSGLKENSDAEWALQFAGHFVHSMHIRVLAPYMPSEAERGNPDLYAKNCQAHMARELERVRRELYEASWRKAAGRTKGGLSYKFGDMSRAILKNVGACLANVLEPKSD